MQCYNVPFRRGAQDKVAMTWVSNDPFRRPLIARSALFRLSLAAGIVACLWGAILWAVALP
jgi:hypothetical protein